MQIQKEVELSRCPHCDSEDIHVTVWGTQGFIRDIGLSMPVDAIELWDDDAIDIWDEITGMIQVDGFAQSRCRDCGTECTFQHDEEKGWKVHLSV